MGTPAHQSGKLLLDIYTYLEESEGFVLMRFVDAIIHCVFHSSVNCYCQLLKHGIYYALCTNVGVRAKTVSTSSGL